MDKPEFQKETRAFRRFLSEDTRDAAMVRSYVSNNCCPANLEPILSFIDRDEHIEFAGWLHDKESFDDYKRILCNIRDAVNEHMANVQHFREQVVGTPSAYEEG
jgi:hypothetical protein